MCLEPQFSLPALPAWDGTLQGLLVFLVSIGIWIGETFAVFLVDIFGAAFLGMACLVWTIFLAPIGYISAAYSQGAQSIGQLGIFAPIGGAFILGLSVLILIIFILLWYNLVVKQSEKTLEEGPADETPGSGETSDIANELE